MRAHNRYWTVDKEVLERLVDECNSSLGHVLEKTRRGDHLAKEHKASWSRRHRLQVLMESARDSAAMLPRAVTKPWLVAELMVVLNLVKRWDQASNWILFEQYLVDPSSFSHAIAVLMIAEHFLLGHYRVRLVLNENAASPDLLIETGDDRNSWTRIECYAPKALYGEPRVLTESKAGRILEKAMAKAKRQLPDRVPGIVAVCSYNQSPESLGVMSRVAQRRLARTTRLNLLGILIVSQDVLISRDADKMIFYPRLRFDLTLNPSYGGPELSARSNRPLPADSGTLRLA